MQQRTANGVTTYLLAHVYPDGPTAKRAWERVESKARGRMPITSVRCLRDGTDNMLVLLAEDAAVINRIVSRVALGGEPVTLEDNEIAAFAARRARAAVDDVMAGRVTDTGLAESIIRRGDNAGERLHSDGTLSPVNRPQG